MARFSAIIVVSMCVGFVLAAPPKDEGKKSMQLGNFSVSLTVKDIKASKQFYEKLGFSQIAGELEQKWVVLQNSSTTIGIFQGMIKKNSLTFNPGWNERAETLETFEDVRDLQKRLQADGIELTTSTDPEGTGPAHISFVDPDGNPILIDQHVAKPQ